MGRQAPCRDDPLKPASWLVQAPDKIVVRCPHCAHQILRAIGYYGDGRRHYRCTKCLNHYTMEGLDVQTDNT